MFNDIVEKHLFKLNILYDDTARKKKQILNEFVGYRDEPN